VSHASTECVSASTHPRKAVGFIPGTGTLDVDVVLADQMAQVLQAKEQDVQIVALEGGVGSLNIFGYRGVCQGLQAL